MNKTLLVGIDAACWAYLDPLLQAGRLPTIERLMNAGVWGVLNSTMPPWTPTAWSSIVTAKNAGKHGVFDMLRHKPGTYEFELTSATARQGTPFWRYLNDAGVRVGLVNVPFSYPPAPVEGFVVCGFGSPGEARDVAWPEGTLEWIEDRFGRYEPVVSTETLRSGMPEQILAAEMKHQSQLIAIAAGLAEAHQVDVLVINLMLTDHANHKMPEMEQVQRAYEQSDADLAVLLNAFQPDNVMLISDHGSSRLKGDFLLNVWLRERGYCVYVENTPRQQAAAFNWIVKQWAEEQLGLSGRTGKLLRRIVQTVVPRLPRAGQERFWARIDRAIPFAQSHVLLSTKPDFSRTPVFPGSLYSGLLYFNIRDREPNGVISAGERSELVARLKTELAEVRDPESGERLFANIFSSEELYHGAVAGHAPDLILDAYHSHWNIRTRQPAPHRGQRHGQYFVTFDHNRDYGWHSADGVFVLAGPAFQPGQSAQTVSLLDIPATLLHMYGVPSPEDWDGRVVRELLAPELGQQPIRTQPGDAEPASVDENVFTVEEADSMISHLRALGYLD